MKWIALAGLLMATIAQAQSTADLADKFVGTLYANFQKSSVAGDLKGCGFDFSVIGRDNTTGKAGFYRTTGSLMLRTDAATLRFVLKIGVQDLNMETMKASHPWAPASAYISARNSSPAKYLLRIPSDVPGYVMFAYPINQASLAAWQGFMETGMIEIGFNRTAKSQDLISEIDAQVRSTKAINGEVVRAKSHEIIEKIGACSLQMTDHAWSNLDAKP